jgi:hypothetical protein
MGSGPDPFRMTGKPETILNFREQANAPIERMPDRRIQSTEKRYVGRY